MCLCFPISTTLNQCVKELSSDLDMDVAIQNLLGVINAYFRADRTYIFEISADGKTLKNTYEYVSDGVSAQIENLQEVPIDVISVWIDHFQKDEVYSFAPWKRTIGMFCLKASEKPGWRRDTGRPFPLRRLRQGSFLP